MEDPKPKRLAGNTTTLFVRKKPSPSSRAASSDGAVGPTSRNGYASVMGLVGELLAAAPRRSRPRLSRADEHLMRDGDEAQLGKAGVIASAGSDAEWRAFVRDHVRRRFDLLMLFDAASTSII